MPRVVIDPAVPDGKALDTEIARLRGLGVGELRARWHTAFRRRAPPHLPRHLLFHILAYRLQADRLGELDADSRRLLDRIGPRSSDETDRLVADLNRSRTELKPVNFIRLSRVRPASIILCSSTPKLSNNIIQKGLAFGCEQSGTVTVPGAPRPRESCPAGCMAEAGLRWWRQ